MDYEKKYKEALNWMKDVYPTLEGAAKEDAEHYFPELKENRDERIKEDIIWCFKHSGIKPDRPINPHVRTTMKDALTWLKKKGVQKLIDKIQLGKKYKCIASPRYSTFMKGKIYKPEDKFLCSLMNFCSDCFEPIEDGEYNLTDEENNIGISEATKQKLEDNLNKALEQETPGSLNKFLDEQGEQNSIDKSGSKVKVKYAGSEYSLLGVRDIDGVIFYEIEDEPNHIDYVLPENCEIVSGYGVKEKGSSYPTKSAIFSEHNPAWSEEDDAMRNFIALILRNHQSDEDFTTFETTFKDCIDWFKSLKERVQPQTKQEWNEDTQQWIDAITKDYKEWYKVNKDHSATIQIKINILKSLKERYTWKPSEEQMEALESLLGLINPNSLHGRELVDLIKQLKKLK